MGEGEIAVEGEVEGEERGEGEKGRGRGQGRSGERWRRWICGRVRKSEKAEV